jgi:hypothetical protein
VRVVYSKDTSVLVWPTNSTAESQVKITSACRLQQGYVSIGLANEFDCEITGQGYECVSYDRMVLDYMKERKSMDLQECNLWHPECLLRLHQRGPPHRYQSL